MTTAQPTHKARILLRPEWQRIGTGLLAAPWRSRLVYCHRLDGTHGPPHNTPKNRSSAAAQSSEDRHRLCVQPPSRVGVRRGSASPGTSRDRPGSPGSPLCLGRRLLDPGPSGVELGARAMGASRSTVPRLGAGPLGPQSSRMVLHRRALAMNGLPAHRQFIPGKVLAPR
jgi:hypothetical protein